MPLPVSPPPPPPPSIYFHSQFCTQRISFDSYPSLNTPTFVGGAIINLGEWLGTGTESSRHGEESSTFLQLMSQYQLTESQYNQQVSDTHLEKLSRSGCKQWKSLPPHLKLEAIVAEDIDKSQKGEREKRHEFLLTWKDMEGSGATYEQLITALLKIKCRRDAEKSCEMLKKPVPQSQQAIATASATSHHAGKHQVL